MLQYYEEIPQLGQKKVAGGSDGLNGKNGVGLSVITVLVSWRKKSIRLKKQRGDC